MDKRINKSINQFIALLKQNQYGFGKVILFGSYARNKQNIDSDIDIALIFDELDDNEKFDIQVQLMLLASQIDSRIEPHPISKSDYYSGNPFFIEIQRTGIEIIQ
nr:nucleotidyltransferase domain-containing protein [Bacteroidota bacterium]